MSIRTAFRGPDDAIHEQRIVGAGAPLLKELAARGGLNELRGLFDPPQKVRGQFLEDWIVVDEFFPNGPVHLLPRFPVLPRPEFPRGAGDARRRVPSILHSNRSLRAKGPGGRPV